MGDHRHRDERRGQVHLAHPERHRRVQGRERRRLDQERSGLAQGLGRRPGLRRDRRGRPGLRARQGPDVHRPRNRSRCGRASRARRTSRSTAIDLGHMSNVGQPGDVAVRTARRAGAHRPALTDRMATPGARLEDLAQRLQATCLAGGSRSPRPSRAPAGSSRTPSRRSPGSSGYFLGGVVSYSNEVKSIDARRPDRGAGRPRRRERPGRGRHGRRRPRAPRRRPRGRRHRRRRTRRRDGRTSRSGSSTSRSPTGPGRTSVASCWPGDRASNIEDSAAAALELLLERATQATAVPPVGAS